MICNLCPRRCGALRTETAGEGFCKMPALPVVARAALHHWEEPPISGTRGSGTIFFTGCNLGCVFCQNQAISRGQLGKPVTVERLRAICDQLIAQGAHNINFVTPTHYPHVIRELLEDHPLPVPVVYNCGGYEGLEPLKSLAGKVDIYLADLKYLDAKAAGRYSLAPDYPEAATAAILEMFRQTGPVEFDQQGLLKRGLVIRHLLLPGQLNGAKEVMDWAARQFPRGSVLFSLMSQYTPWGDLSAYPEVDRKLRKGEMRAARDYMDALGLEGFCQEGESARREYTPEFDLTGII